MSEHTAPEITVAEIVAALVDTAFGTDTEVTAYKVATVVNGVFKATGTDKEIRTQMMYNYTRNGLVAKGKKGSASEIRYTKDEVTAFVTKYTNKFIGK